MILIIFFILLIIISYVNIILIKSKMYIVEKIINNMAMMIMKVLKKLLGRY